MRRPDTGEWTEVVSKNKQDNHAQYIGAPGEEDLTQINTKPKTITQLIREHKNGYFRPSWILDIEVYIFKSPISLNHGDKSYIKFVLCQDRTETKNILYLHNLLLKEPDHPFNGLEFRIILK